MAEAKHNSPPPPPPPPPAGGRRTPRQPRFQITARTKKDELKFSGVHPLGGLRFVDGVAITDSEALAEEFDRQGFDVETVEGR